MGHQPALITSVFAAWAFIGFIWMILWMICSIFYNAKQRSDYVGGDIKIWDKLPKEETKPINKECRRRFWRGLKHYIIGHAIIVGWFIIAVVI